MKDLYIKFIIKVLRFETSKESDPSSTVCFQFMYFSWKS